MIKPTTKPNLFLIKAEVFLSDELSGSSEDLAEKYVAEASNVKAPMPPMIIRPTTCSGDMNVMNRMAIPIMRKTIPHVVFSAFVRSGTSVCGVSMNFVEVFL